MAKKRIMKQKEDILIYLKEKGLAINRKKIASDLGLSLGQIKNRIRQLRKEKKIGVMGIKKTNEGYKCYVQLKTAEGDLPINSTPSQVQS